MYESDPENTCIDSRPLIVTKYFNIIMRIVVAAYFVYLTILLFSQDPTRWVSTSGSMPDFLQLLMPIAHLLSFSVLSFLTFASCLPMPKLGIFLFLALYGGATEIIQSAIPHRSRDVMDWLQDLCGIAIGFACFWLAVFFFRIIRRNKSQQADFYMAAKSMPE
jgi:VanZ family protein